jgi:hypothetical protein
MARKDEVFWAATYINWESIEDDYEQGELGSSQIVLSDSIFIKERNPDALIKGLSAQYGLPEERDAWSAFDNRLECQFTVNEDNAQASQRELDAWKARRKKLWTAHVSVDVAHVSMHHPSTDEIAKTFRVEDMGD